MWCELGGHDYTFREGAYGSFYICTDCGDTTSDPRIMVRKSQPSASASLAFVVGLVVVAASIAYVWAAFAFGGPR